ncbi:HdeD family acid-resistance protein [Cerasicoccus fimbriatus]|uniref:HdeD family acid-resistance protein n=1 Tax=Cerasicoccus fimbriatus TaxID=3014554 RepID=UPI0022B30770|nr:DUF308 domain-containing protein [Cerasicoccus sp. TK19100]
MATPVNPFAGINPDLVKKNAGKAQMAGIILIVLGVLAVMLPGLFSLGLELFLGWLIILAGFTQIAAAFSHKGVHGQGWALLNGVFAVIAGGLLVAKPVLGVIALTALLGIFYAVDGVFKIIASIQAPSQPGRGLVLINGVFGLIIAGIAFSEWPSAAHWFIGIMVGVNFLMVGMTLLSLATAAKKSV